MTGKRLILIPALLAAALVPAWPAWLGWQADRHLAAYQGGRMGDLVVDHSLESFERGWLESSATSRMRVTTGGGDLHFDVRHRIRHGFGGYVVESLPVYPAGVAERLEAIFGEDAPLSVTTYPSATGDSAEIRMHSPAFSAALPDDPDVRMDSAGLDGVFHVDAGRLSGRIRAPGFTLHDDAGRLALQGQVLELELAEPGNRVADAWIEYRVEALELSAPGKREPISLERLRVRSAQQRQGDFLEVGLDMGFAGLATHGWEASQGDLRLRLGPLHAATYDALLRDLERLPEQAADAAAPGELAGPVLMEHLPGLLAHSPALNLEPFRVQLPSGSVEIALEFGFDGGDAEAATEAPLQRIRLIGHLRAGRDVSEELAGFIGLQAMGGQGDAAVDPETRRLLAAPLGRGMIRGLVEDGYLEADGDGYRADVRMEDGRLIVNGEDRSEWLYLLLAGLFAPGGFN